MTIGKRIIGGYAIVLALLVIVAAVAFYSLKATEREYEGFLNVDAQAIIRAMELGQEARDQVAQYRGLLLYPDQRSRLANDLRESHRQFDALLDKLRSLSRSEAGTRLVDEIADAQKKYKEAQEQGIRLVEQGKLNEAIALSNKLLPPLSTALRDKVEQYIARQQKQLAEGRSDVARALDSTFLLLSSISVLAIVLGLAFGALLTRSITRQLLESIAQLSSSSSEILATTTQVAAGSAETATAVSETTATMEEVNRRRRRSRPPLSSRWRAWTRWLSPWRTSSRRARRMWPARNRRRPPRSNCTSWGRNWAP